MRRMVIDKLQKPSDITPPPAEAKIAAAVFDRYVGQYDFPPNRVMTVSRDGDKFLTQLGAQPQVQIFATGEREYFTKVVDSRISFVVNENGEVTELVLHQNGQDLHAPRLSEAEAQAKVDAFQKRIQSKTAVPGSEAALR